MASKAPRIPDSLRDWITARQRHRLSHAHVQMARELGMNPRKLGKLDNAHQEPWKLPLPKFLESLYLKRFGRERPEQVRSIEEHCRLLEKKKAIRRQSQAQRQAAAQSGADSAPESPGTAAQPED